MNRPSWDQLYFTMCYLISMRSRDPNTHFGSVITDADNVLVSTGYNSLPRGIEPDADGKRMDRKQDKYAWMEHAERNAIYNAARRGTQLKGCVLYITSTPCMDCARAIVQTGIAKVKIHKQGHETYVQNHDRWVHNRTLELFDESGVEYEFVDCQIVSTQGLLNDTEYKVEE